MGMEKIASLVESLESQGQEAGQAWLQRMEWATGLAKREEAVQGHLLC